MSDAQPLRLADLTTEEVRAWPAGSVALLPVGSLEPHGPHLPLGTDALLSDEACVRAARRLRDEGTFALVAPPVPYGVTDFAAGFAGAVSVPAALVTGFLRAVVEGLLQAGFAHVCLVNNHLEPAHDAAVRAALDGLAPGRASVACPLTRRWARTLSDEFKRGNCHAGRYETSLVLAAGGAVRDGFEALPALEVSLATGIKEGKTSFRAIGMQRAYTGAPADASTDEGHELYAKLVEMIVTEAKEGLSAVQPEA
jgi:creatinine amidohydrolase